MGYLSVIASFAIKISSAITVGIILLLYMNQQLNDKADKTELDKLKESKADKEDVKDLKSELVRILKEKLEASNDIMLVNISKLERVFETQNDKMQGIVDIQIETLEKHIKRIEGH